MMQAAPIPTIPDGVPEIVKEDPVIEPEPIVLQPPSRTSNLRELEEVDRLFVTRKLRVRTVLYLRGKKNKFFIRTPDQNLLYTVEEENRWWVGYLFYGLRPLVLRVTNAEGIEVLRVRRPYACTTRFMPCQLQHMEVYVPPGSLIGTVEQIWSPLRPKYVVKNEEGDDLFIIDGPRVTVSCFQDVQFSISRCDGSPVGATCKRWEGLLHALFTAPLVERFGVAFENSLSAEEKALLMAATLLMDYMYFDV